jgi:hypothetical protein
MKIPIKIIIMLMCILNLIVNSSKAVCLVADQEIYQAQSCECVNWGDPNPDEFSFWSDFMAFLTAGGSCSGQQNNSFLFRPFGATHEASPNESGYYSLGYSYQQVGTKYPCIPEENYFPAALCSAAAVACSILCEATLVGCLCIAGFILGCKYCVLHDCVADTNDPQGIYDIAISSYGTPCSG